MATLIIIVFGIFLYTIHPTITAGDSGEIAAAAFSLGIPHPPGYPLYLAVANPLTILLPFGSPAYRINIVSAALGALSCLMVYLITHKITQKAQIQPSAFILQPSRISAFLAPLFLALSHEFWYRSTVAEVYTLNTFLMLLIIYILLAWRESSGVQKFRSSEVQPSSFILHPSSLSPGSRLLYLASFILGLSIGNHHTIVLLIPGVLVFVFWHVWKSGVMSHVGDNPVPFIAHCSLLIAFFLLGLSVYLYLPVRSARDPFMDWGDPQNLRNFIDVFTRKGYLPEEIARGWAMLFDQLKTFNPIGEFKLIGFFFALFGVWELWKDKAVLFLLTATLLLTSYGLIFLAGHSTRDVELLRKFFLPSYAVFPIFIGIAIAMASKSGTSWSVIAFSLAVISLSWQFMAHYPKNRNSCNYLAYDYGINELNSLSEGSVYVSKGEIKTFPLWYLQGVERYRDDVRVITAYFLTQGWYARETLRLAGAAHGAPPGLTYRQMLVDAIYREYSGKGVYTGFLDEAYIPKNLHAHTNGITFRLSTDKEERRDRDVWPTYRLRGIRRVGRNMESGIKEILKDYASSHYNTGLKYHESGDKKRATAEFEKALDINPDDPDSLNNLAALYADQGIRLNEAEEMAKRAMELYAAKEDKEIAEETLKEVLKKREVLGL